jgi:hypothetical protein
MIVGDLPVRIPSTKNTQEQLHPPKMNRKEKAAAKTPQSGVCVDEGLRLMRDLCWLVSLEQANSGDVLSVFIDSRSRYALCR